MKNGYFKQAYGILAYANKELEDARADGKNGLKLRQVSEKGYLSLITAINGLFVANGAPKDNLPKGDRGKVSLLEKYVNNSIIRQYHGLRERLHIEGFHDGTLDEEEVEKELASLGEFLDI